MMPGYITPVANHLWQSTLFAAAAGLLALALRKNRASVRYWLWLAASVKFLIPFALLVSAGRQMQWPVSPAPTQAVRPLSDFVAGVGQPFLSPVVEVPKNIAQKSVAPILIPAVWLCGFLVAGLSWLRRWREVRAAVRYATPVCTGLPIPVMYSNGRLEPGIVGIWRPALVLPEGIQERLTTAQLAGVLAHEMCHVRRRDNLAVAIHMVVESTFWFHPLVWWIRERLIDERERACDEEVVRLGCEPEVYAEGILNVCKWYLESPACVSGVTGADLKQRIEGIMRQRILKELNAGKRLLLGTLAALAVASPVAIGMLHSPPMRAQDVPAARFEVASVKADPSADVRALRKFQMLPGGRLTVENVSLYGLILSAYGASARSVQMSGELDWIQEERYNIDATAEKGAVPANLPATVREERMRRMLQALLAERFKLVVRRGSKEQPVYAVTVAKGGIKMAKAAVEEKDCGEDNPCHTFMGGQGRGVHGKAVTVEDLISFVENWSDRPIIDRTELRGLYNMNTDGWVPMRERGGGNEGMDDPVRPTIFTVFEKQLGLKLEPAKAVVDVFEIEHVERPTGN